MKENYISRNLELDAAAKIIGKYGTDSQLGLSLRSDNSYYFGMSVPGVLPYTLAGKRVMSQGDPAGRLEDIPKLTDEYLAFCKSKGYRPVFNSVSHKMARLLETRGFCVLKYGEEAILELGSFSLSGGKKGALRRNVAKLDRAGVFSEEYCPQAGRDQSLEGEITELEKQWFADKKLKLTYSVGDLQFDMPYGRRYFLSRDADGKLLTVLSFLPYKSGKGYCVDVMYRKLDGPTGEMEHAIISAAMKMKEEGVEEVSLNIAPLAGIDVTKPDTDKIEELMHAIYNNMDFGYDFKNLYRFKSKFDPTTWKERYLVYDRRISPVRLATSITRTKGVADPRLYMRYKRFFVSYILFPERYREQRE